MGNRMNLGFALIGFALLTILNSLFVVDFRQRALVKQFGEIVGTDYAPGLHFKVPVLQNVAYYDSRILDLDPPGQDMALVDQRRVSVDSFARYRIVDPLRYYQSVMTEAAFRDRFGNILNSSVRDALGRTDLADLLGAKRPDVMHEITQAVKRREGEFGINVIEVRIGVRALAHHPHRQEHREREQRHVHPEDRPPRQELDQRAAPRRA